MSTGVTYSAQKDANENYEKEQTLHLQIHSDFSGSNSKTAQSKYCAFPNGHDPDTNQKLKQRIFNNLKAGASVAIWHFNTQYMKNMTMVYPVKMECG